MSINSSSSFGSLLYCGEYQVVVYILSAYFLSRISLLFPISIFVFYLGYQRWRQQRSFATMSHLDIFTYHSVAAELSYGFWNILYTGSSYTGLSVVPIVADYIAAISLPAQLFLHILTCVERYLAVVHPVTYLGMKQSGGIRIRNISIGCTWLLSFAWISFMASRYPEMPFIPFCCLLALALFIISFCCLSVLCVLIHPSPGDRAGVKKQVDQSKQRAFHMVLAIMGMLWLWFLGSFVFLLVARSQLMSGRDGCLFMASGSWLSLPSSLVLPMMFLYRAGKLPCFPSSDK